MILHDDKHVCVFSLRKAVMRQPTLASEDAKVSGLSQLLQCCQSKLKVTALFADDF